MFRDPRYLAPLGVLARRDPRVGRARAEGSGAAAPPRPPSAATATPTSAPVPRRRPTAPPIDARACRTSTKVRDALLAYRRQHGKFPVTKNGITTICAAPSDPGCVLAAGRARRAVRRWRSAVLVLSDGARVVLVAPRADARPMPAQCPRDPPRELAGAARDLPRVREAGAMIGKLNARLLARARSRPRARLAAPSSSPTTSSPRRRASSCSSSPSAPSPPCRGASAPPRSAARSRARTACPSACSSSPTTTAAPRSTARPACTRVVLPPPRRRGDRARQALRPAASR